MSVSLASKVIPSSTPNLNKYALDGENFKNTAITTTPKLYVSFTKTDVNANAQTLVVNGFVNDGNLGKDELNGSLAVPTNVLINNQCLINSSIIGMKAIRASLESLIEC